MAAILKMNQTQYGLWHWHLIW